VKKAKNASACYKKFLYANIDFIRAEIIIFENVVLNYGIMNFLSEKVFYIESK